MLLVDSREPAILKTAIIQAIPSAQILKLECADFVLYDQDGCSLGIERKTWSDLLGSAASGRLEDQLTRISESYLPLLLIEGKVDRTSAGLISTGGHASGWKHGPLQMYLLSLLLQFSTLCLYTPTLAGTVEVIRLLESRCEIGCWRQSIRESRSKLMNGQGEPAISVRPIVTPAMFEKKNRERSERNERVRVRRRRKGSTTPGTE